MNSLNHYAYDFIESWLYEKVAGITALEPGYKKIRTAPFLTKGMTEVSASRKKRKKFKWALATGTMNIGQTADWN